MIFLEPSVAKQDRFDEKGKHYTFLCTVAYAGCVFGFCITGIGKVSWIGLLCDVKS